MKLLSILLHIAAGLTIALVASLLILSYFARGVVM